MSSPKGESAADAAPGWHHTHSYSSHQLQIKYEDCILAEPANGQREWAVFGIFDGELCWLGLLHMHALPAPPCALL